MAPTALLERTKGKFIGGDRSSKMMGKSQKFSRGVSSGFVPDYRHAVEMMGESEGLEGLVRVKSEGSSAPKKCVSLNADINVGLNAPLRVISWSNMLGSERKELEMRLRAELEQVHTLQKRIGSTSSSMVAVSSSSNGHAKNPNLMGQGGSQWKRGITEPTKQIQPPPSARNSDVKLMKQCEQILKHMMTHKHGWVFKHPVDAVKMKIPDYYTVIKHPMDLGTIKIKVASGAYSSPRNFAADVRLMFTNAMTYNGPGSDVYLMADDMRNFFEERWRPLEKKLAEADSHTKQEAEPAKMMPHSKKRKVVPSINHNVAMHERLKPNMTVKEKESMRVRLESQQEDLPCHILDDYQRKEHARHQSDPDPCRMEIISESGLRNLSMHPCKGNEPVDEDVDIGGNDPPISSYPPGKIEKDTAPRSSKGSSSGSSSSDSGSCSETDSGSASGSESGGGVGTVAKTTKAIVGRQATLDRQTSDITNPLEINRAASVLEQQEDDSRRKPAVSVERDGGEEGENAPSERQVSPDKLFRAALLRNRFADTILKAREKTLGQSEKGDPEKMRREREELERQQKEEKARLQAEAIAAEVACRRAEAEAAADAKRKRELDREAARQALLKMEKTVEINASSLFLNDLDILRTISGEHTSSSAGETSPNECQDGLEGLDLRGSNPLERLGLFMKPDDDGVEEEEEVLARVAPLPPTDVEEGEIG